jgi:uncharacterized protein
MPQVLLQEKRQAILELAAKYGASDVRVFGSVARGEATAESDLDLLVKLRQGVSLWDVGSLTADLEELLGCKVDVAPEEWLRPQIREYALQEAFPL